MITAKIELDRSTINRRCKYSLNDIINNGNDGYYVSVEEGAANIIKFLGKVYNADGSGPDCINQQECSMILLDKQNNLPMYTENNYYRFGTVKLVVTQEE